MRRFVVFDSGGFGSRSRFEGSENKGCWSLCGGFESMRYNAILA